MPASERPPPHPEHEENEGAESHREGREGARRLVERLLKKAVEKGVEQITETPENVRQFVHDMKLPREVVALLMQQVDDTKNGLYRAVAKELRDFLEQTNLAEEFIRALTTLSFEIKTEIRFIPNDQRFEGDKQVKPDVKATVRVNNGKEPKEKEPKEGEE